MASAVEVAGKSVVRVEGRRRLPASGIVWSAEGVIVTAHHVVEQDENIGIGLPDGGTLTAALVGRDPTTDLAVLRAAGARLAPPTWIEPGSLRVGSLALALGRPGRTVQATLGVISALGEAWRTPGGGAIDRYLQTDVVMYPGFSGGALVTVGGQFAGLNTSALMPGISLSIPAPTIRRVVEALLAHGRVPRGYLGISTQPVRLPAALQESLGQETGLLVVAVEGGSPAERDGLVLGDVIVGLEGAPVRHHDDLLSRLTAERIGKPVSLRIVRAGGVQEFQVTAGERSR
jgi:S1-C subfamily serine protease